MSWIAAAVAAVIKLFDVLLGISRRRDRMEQREVGRLDERARAAEEVLDRITEASHVEGRYARMPGTTNSKLRQRYKRKKDHT